MCIKTCQQEKFSWLLHILMATYTCPHTSTYGTSLLLHFFVSLYKNTLQNDPLYPIIPFPLLSISSKCAYWFLVSTLHKNLPLELLVDSILSNLTVNLQSSSSFPLSICPSWSLPFSLPVHLDSRAPSLLVSIYLTGKFFSNFLVILPKVHSSTTLSSIHIPSFSDIYSPMALWLPVFIFINTDHAATIQIHTSIPQLDISIWSSNRSIKLKRFTTIWFFHSFPKPSSSSSVLFISVKWQLYYYISSYSDQSLQMVFDFTLSSVPQI